MRELHLLFLLLLAFLEVHSLFDKSRSMGERDLTKSVEIKVLIFVSPEYSAFVCSVIPFH